MSKVSVKIDTDNAAFRRERGGLETEEVKRALAAVAAKIDAGQRDGTVFDTNGAASTTFKVTEDPQYEWEVQGNYDGEWDLLTTGEDKADAYRLVDEYRAEDPGVGFRVRRVKVNS